VSEEKESLNKSESVIGSIWNIDTPKHNKKSILKGFTEKKKQRNNNSTFQ
jgi:hypothetical protein